MKTSSLNRYTESPSPMLDKAGKPVVPRIKTPQEVRDIHKCNWDDDIGNRRLRAQVQLLLDGDPPFNQEKMDAAGLGDCCNVSSGYGRMAISRKMEPYVQALNTMPVLLKIKTRMGSPQQRLEWQEIMSRNHRKMLKRWKPFRFRYLLQALYCISHGASFAYFQDSIDWRWNVSPTGDMVVDRLSRADTTEFETVSTEVDFRPSEIWSHVEEIEEGKQWSKGDEGWNKSVCRTVVENAAGKDFFNSGDEELSVRRFKNRDVTATSKSKVCTCIILWCTETDGSVTQYIVPKKNDTRQGNEEFLMKETKFFKSMEDGIVTFVRDIGTNGYFHSIRGTGANIYASARRQDILKCRMDDAIAMEMSIPVRATEEALLNENAFTFAGPFLILNDGVKIEKDMKVVNYSNSAIPAMQMFRQDWMEQQGASNPSPLSTRDATFEDQPPPMTGADVMEYSLWHDSWERLLIQSLRRVVSIFNSGSRKMPGGDLAFEFVKWCLEEGVPEEVLSKGIDFEECYACKPIGNGSPAARLYSMERLLPLAASMDEQGRNSTYRLYTASLPGMDWTHADEFFPEVPGQRPTQEYRNADYENNFLAAGIGQVQMLPNDDHIVHMMQHSVPMEAIRLAVEEGRMEQWAAIKPLMPLYNHFNEHLQAASQDKILASQVSKFAQMLHNLGEIMTNGQRELEKMKRDKKGPFAQQKNGNGQAPVAGPNGEREEFGGLSVAELSLLAKTQASIRAAQRNADERQALHDKRIEIMDREAARKDRESKARTQMKDYEVATNILAKREKYSRTATRR